MVKEIYTYYLDVGVDDHCFVSSCTRDICEQNNDLKAKRVCVDVKKLTYVNSLT